MVDIRNQIEDYLVLLNMKYSWNEKEGLFELVFSERKDGKPADPEMGDDASTFQYTLYISPGLKWIQVYTDVYPLDKIPKDKQNAVFLDFLEANRKYAEVCFDFDKKRGFIGTSQEMMIQGLNFDLFREEFLAVPWAVKNFWTEIATRHNLK
ncbi:hypothetical protein EU527_07935 [Candidatus Thorarchaeota archaeon]|nr:MAG: hypothetical protein EU527_07935 [Candidatus Thorarchaeota archaeon]